MKTKILFLVIIMTTFTSSSCGGSQHKEESRKPLDFSTVWTSYQDDVLGYVGENYQRFYFLIDSVKPDIKDTLLYCVWGKYRIKDRISFFEGLAHVVKYSELSKEYGVREDSPLSGIQTYSLITEWDLKAKEDNEKINGRMTSTFYMVNGDAVFDDLDIGYCDSYCNNQFEGILSSSTYGKQKCRWGTFRIPDSEGLDIGAGEFSPHEKYLANGWQSYHDAFVEGTEEGWNKEKQSHWTLQ